MIGAPESARNRRALSETSGGGGAGLSEREEKLFFRCGKRLNYNPPAHSVPLNRVPRQFAGRPELLPLAAAREKTAKDGCLRT